MKITFLGICANQTATYEGVSFIVDTDVSILVDAGPGVVRQILRAGRLCTGIAHVIITHSHGDHTLGFPYFIWNHFYEGLSGQKGPEIIHVYTTSSLIPGLKNMLDFCYEVGKYPFKVEYHTIPTDKKGRLNIAGTLLQTIPVNHTVQNFGIRIDWDSKCVAYSSDTIYHKPFVELASKCDLLIHEGFVTEELVELSRKVKHGTAKDAGKTATETHASQLALVHLFPPFLKRKKDLVAEAKKEFKGKVFVPDELTVVEI